MGTWGNSRKDNSFSYDLHVRKKIDRLKYITWIMIIMEHMKFIKSKFVVIIHDAHFN